MTMKKPIHQLSKASELQAFIQVRCRLSPRPAPPHARTPT